MSFLGSRESGEWSHFLGSVFDRGGKEAGWVEEGVKLQCSPNGPQMTSKGGLAVKKPITVILS